MPKDVRTPSFDPTAWSAVLCKGTPKHNHVAATSNRTEQPSRTRAIATALRIAGFCCFSAAGGGRLLLVSSDLESLVTQRPGGRLTRLVESSRRSHSLLTPVDSCRISFPRHLCSRFLFLFFVPLALLTKVVICGSRCTRFQLGGFCVLRAHCSSRSAPVVTLVCAGMCAPPLCVPPFLQHLAAACSRVRCAARKGQLPMVSSAAGAVAQFPRSFSGVVFHQQ